jgi:putative spermidine/putrescine transport system ATP-binding protein
MSYLRLTKVVKTFNKEEVVKQLSLDIRQGELISFLGPSGCGKTTTLNMIAGFLDVDGGSIHVDGKPVHHLPAYKRNMGMVFQNYALFPHMTVFDNVAFGLKLRNIPRNEIEKRVKVALEMTRLNGFEHRYPKQLSGGQQQRVSLSRALVIEPTVLLLDEPLSNLDAKLRQEMRDEIIEIQRKVGITTIFVTHDQEEALAISDRIAVMYNGKIEQLDNPESIYNNPQTAFVASFIGEVNKLSATVVDTSLEKSTVLLYQNRVKVKTKERVSANESVMLYIRPEKIHLAKTQPDNYPSVGAMVERKIFLGSKTRFITRVEDRTLIVEMPNSQMDRMEYNENEKVYLYWSPEDLLVAENEV